MRSDRGSGFTLSLKSRIGHAEAFGVELLGRLLLYMDDLDLSIDIFGLWYGFEDIK